MKSARTILRAFKFALQNFWRNIRLSRDDIGFVLTLTMINMLVVVHVLTQAAVSQVEDRIDVSVYFKRGTTETTILGAREYLINLSQVRSAEYISSEEAYAHVLPSDTEVTHPLSARSTPLNPIRLAARLLFKREVQRTLLLYSKRSINPQFGDAIEKRTLMITNGLLRAFSW